MEWLLWRARKSCEISSRAPFPVESQVLQPLTHRWPSFPQWLEVQRFQFAMATGLDGRMAAHELSKLTMRINEISWQLGKRQIFRYFFSSCVGFSCIMSFLCHSSGWGNRPSILCGSDPLIPRSSRNTGFGALWIRAMKSPGVQWIR